MLYIIITPGRQRTSICMLFGGSEPFAERFAKLEDRNSSFEGHIPQDTCLIVPNNL